MHMQHAPAACFLGPGTWASIIARKKYLSMYLSIDLLVRRLKSYSKVDREEQEGLGKAK